MKEAMLSHNPVSSHLLRTGGLVCLLLILLNGQLLAQDHKKFSPEFLEAIKLTPDIENGKKLYKGCIACHGTTAWGNRTGAYPQIAGQLKNVIIKQLADFRAGNRDNPMMRAFTTERALGSAQDIADVSAYIASMPMSDQNDKGPHYDAENGARVYEELCSKCHGKQAEGIEEDGSPLLYAQHYNYLKRQFDWIRLGQRRNAEPKMTKQIQNIGIKDEIDVLSYVANLPPPKEKLAPQGWQNPDFPHY